MVFSKKRLILTLSCPDRVGIVAAVSGFIAQHQGWITDAQHHTDEEAMCFFMRQEILADSLPFDCKGFQELFTPIAQTFQMNWRLTDSDQKKRVILFVSKPEHCLYDLFARWQSQDLEMDIVGVISNHELHRKFVEWHGIPFVYLPIDPDHKPQIYEKIQHLCDEWHGDVIVLARYMQILPSAFCADYPCRILNIHHSFLPSFIGARPYHQAYARGVKLIGATCHYVTAELDEGPIIEQDVIRIDHSDSVEDLIRYGKDIEKTVLARGLKAHLEDRVLVHHNKTLVFR